MLFTAESDCAAVNARTVRGRRSTSSFCMCFIEPGALDDSTDKLHSGLDLFAGRVCGKKKKRQTGIPCLVRNHCVCRSRFNHDELCPLATRSKPTGPDST
jgi:hypothetical protein